MGDSSNTGGGGGAADSYIGSHISLTSKSEIRYEGILYTVDTANSNIALKDVRSFGTEGRKKDGPQVAASDKVYDYIIFRGTDIKDLQVKLSPPVRQTQSQQPHHDPAIISLQSQTSPMAPPAGAGNPQTSAATSATAPDSTDVINQGPYSSIPSANYQASMPPLYQPYAGLGSWAMPPIPPGTNGTMGMPMYWPGYYRPLGGISHLQQQSPLSFQSPPSLPNYLTQSRSPAQQPLAAPTSMPLLVPDSNKMVSQSLSARESTQNFSQDFTASNMTLPTLSSAFQASTQLVLPAEKNIMDAKLASGSSQRTSSAISIPQSSGFFIAPSALSTAESAASLDLTKGFDSHKQHVVSEHLSVDYLSTDELVNSTVSTSQVQSSANQPLLPLPAHTKQFDQVYGVSTNSMLARRGRGRGRAVGNPQSQSQFMEDFDFTAMNEKFKKDEVWGKLGKADFRERGEGDDDIADEAHYEEEDLSRNVPVYVKDDFFDTLSCDTFGRGGQTERTKSSEQHKIDTETFGRFSVRSRGGRGGRGGYRGNSRGGYYGGRLAGNGGRGRSYARNTSGY